MKKIEKGLFEKLIDNVNDGIYFLDAQRQITLWNQGAENITGYKKEEVLGRCCKEDILNPASILPGEICKLPGRHVVLSKEPVEYPGVLKGCDFASPGEIVEPTPEVRFFV